MTISINNNNPWLIHVNVWQKPLQYYKVISLQLIKINGKKIIIMVPMKNQMEKMAFFYKGPLLLDPTNSS